MKIETSMILTCAVVAVNLMAAGCKKEEPVYVEQPAPTVTTPPPPVTPTPVGCDPANLATFAGIFASRAPTEAPQMRTDGSIVCGNVAEGGTVEGPAFFLEQGSCYTVIANSLPNVTEVDVSLIVDASAVGLPPNIVAMAATPLAVDSETGAMGTIGPKANCYRWVLPIPAPVKVVVKARNGSGPIGAQVFKK